MPKARNPKEGVARKLYRQGRKLAEIARLLEVPQGTVRWWKSTYRWNEEPGVEPNKKPDKEPDRGRLEGAGLTEPSQLPDNQELTQEQLLFCLEYLKCFNGAKAYQKAYQCDDRAAQCRGGQLLCDPRIREEIARLKQSRLNRSMLEPEDIFQRYMDIAFSDITMFLNFGKRVSGSGNSQDCGGDSTEGYTAGSFLDLKDSCEIDGSLISEISITKSGIRVKLLDRMKALQWLSEHMDLATELQRVQVEKLKGEVSRMNGETKKNRLAEVLRRMEDRRRG